MHPFLWLGAALLVLWVVAWLVLKVVGFAVHVLLIAAAVFIVWGFVKGAARKVGIGSHDEANRS